MQDFRKLQVWERSHRLVLELYRLTAEYPAEERFGIVSQLRRAAVSIPTNIAEGSKRRQPRDFAHFLNIAESSLAETEYLLILSKDLGYLLGRGPLGGRGDRKDAQSAALQSAGGPGVMCPLGRRGWGSA